MGGKIAEIPKLKAKCLFSTENFHVENLELFLEDC